MNLAASVLGLLALSTVATIPFSGPPVCAVSISRNTITAGEYVAVGWSAAGGLTHTLTNTGLVESGGSRIFQLTNTTRFDFVVQNQYGNCVDSEVVYVTPRPQQNDDVSVFARMISSIIGGNKNTGNTNSFSPSFYSAGNAIPPTYYYYPTTNRSQVIYGNNENQTYYPRYESSFYHPDTNSASERIFEYSPFEDGAMHRAGYVATEDAAPINQDQYGPFETYGPPEPPVSHLYDVAPAQTRSDGSDSYWNQNDNQWTDQPPVFPERNFATDPWGSPQYETAPSPNFDLYEPEFSLPDEYSL